MTDDQGGSGIGGDSVPGRRPTLPVRIALVCAAAGLLAAFAVPGAPPGAGLTVAALGVIAAAAWSGAFRRDPWTLGTVVCAALLSTAAVLRDAAWLVAGDVLLAIGLTSIAAGGAHHARAAVRDAVAAAMRWAPALAPVAAAVARTIPVPGSTRSAPILRGSVLAVALLAVFGSLFASADGAFAHLLAQALPETAWLEGAPARLLALVLGTGLAAAVAITGRRPASATRPFRPPRRRVGRTEWTISLAALVALFAAFVAVQLTVLFGGDDHVLRTSGLTYAEYVHQGFGQLLIVAVLTLALVAAASRYVDGPPPRGLLLALMALALVVCASGLFRLDGYVDAFGPSRLRLVAGAVMAWIGGLLVLAAAALVLRGGWPARAVTLFTAVVAVAFTGLNPDGWVAARAVERAKPDTAYLARLSADAAPALMRLEPALRACVVRDMTVARDAGLRGANVARSRARKALRGQSALGCPYPPRAEQPVFD